MKIRVIEKPRIVCSNPDGLHNYFGWPSVARLQDGSLMAVASGFRVAHVCPFGKVVAIRSRDEGRVWSAPEVIVDTPLDDRDAGILPVGERLVLVTSFTNTPAFQRGYADRSKLPYINAYLDLVEARGGWERYYGATLAISRDGGYTFSSPRVLPISAPHGPCVLSDGTILYVGSLFEAAERQESCIRCYELNSEGEATFRSQIPLPDDDVRFCEPHALALPGGRILVQIRGENYKTGVFTLYQSVSDDGGYTFSLPSRLLGESGGAPAHMIRHSSGAVISVYGYRRAPYGIRAMISRDGGKSYTADLILVDDEPSADLGYPSSVELENGDILTIYYTKVPEGGSVLKQLIWRPEE